jgi:hypothetical protein
MFKLSIKSIKINTKRIPGKLISSFSEGTVFRVVGSRDSVDIGDIVVRTHEHDPVLRIVDSHDKGFIGFTYGAYIDEEERGYFFELINNSYDDYIQDKEKE